MKKKILIISIGIIVIAILGIVLGIILNNKNSKSMVNPSFGKYNGIYQYNGYKFKILHNNDMIYYMVYKNGELVGNSSGFVDSSKVQIDDFNFSFNGNSLKIKSSTKTVPSGEYKKTSGFSTNEIYNDYIGNVNLYNNKYNGKFILDDYTIYTVQTKDNEIRFKTIIGDELINILVPQVGKDHFSSNFFDSNYDLQFSNNELYFTATDKEKENNTNNGKYIKDKTLTKKEIIKLFLD